jgi:hypothetical protein
MEAAAASPKVAAKTGVPQSVAREFRAADRAQPGRQLPAKAPPAKKR